MSRKNITNKFDFETICAIGAVLWGNLPNDIENSNSLNSFKIKVKQWTSDNCPLKICRNFIMNLGYKWKPHIMVLLHFEGGVFTVECFDPRVFSGPKLKLKIKEFSKNMIK